jgi:hypothetical protein
LIANQYKFTRILKLQTDLEDNLNPCKVVLGQLWINKM